jgi:hypothetical protein
VYIGIAKMRRRPVLRSLSSLFVCLGVLLIAPLYVCIFSSQTFISTPTNVAYHSVVAPSPLPTMPGWRSIDESPIHIVQTFCIYDGLKATDPGLTAMRSILAARAAGASRHRRYVFHVLVDEASAL